MRWPSLVRWTLSRLLRSPHTACDWSYGGKTTVTSMPVLSDELLLRYRATQQTHYRLLLKKKKNHPLSLS